MAICYFVPWPSLAASDDEEGRSHTGRGWSSLVRIVADLLSLACLLGSQIMLHSGRTPFSVSTMSLGTARGLTHSFFPGKSRQQRQKHWAARSRTQIKHQQKQGRTWTRASCVLVHDVCVTSLIRWFCFVSGHIFSLPKLTVKLNNLTYIIMLVVVNMHTVFFITELSL